MKRLIAMTFILISLCFICSCKSDIHSRVSDEDWEYIYNLGYEDGEMSGYDEGYNEGYFDGLDAGEEYCKDEARSILAGKIDDIESDYLFPFIDDYARPFNRNNSQMEEDIEYLTRAFEDLAYAVE